MFTLKSERSRPDWSNFIFLFVVLLGMFVVFTRQTTLILAFYSTHPRDLHDFHTAFTGSWLHGSWEHLWGNISALAGLGTVFILLFPKKMPLFFVTQWILSGVILFFLGRSGQSHLGASTWAYSFASFLAIVALSHQNHKAKSILFLVVLFYGTMWWGLLPLIPGISWQGHLSGTLSGILIALFRLDFWTKAMNIPREENKNTEAFDDEPLPKNPYDEI
jgi:membrane associated rhomboid family serine protease